MNDTIVKLEDEIRSLDKIIDRAEASLKKAPKGILRISKSGNATQYYCRKDEKDKNGKYIKKKDRGLACELAQKEYDNDILKVARRQRIEVCKFLKKYLPNQIMDIYNELPLERQVLIRPYILTQTQYVEKWKSRTYIGKEFAVGTPEIYTERGERVRSKSEKIIADKLDLMNIPYLYEYPIKLMGYGTVYPDFTLLNVRTREEFYLEHFGMMDDSKYSEKAVAKIELYEKSGIFPGDKLLMTFETSKSSINMKIFEKMIKKYLL